MVKFFKHRAVAMMLALAVGGLAGAAGISGALGAGDAPHAAPPAAVRVSAAAAPAAPVSAAVVVDAVFTKITGATAGVVCPFTSYHSKPWTVTGSDRHSLRNDVQAFGTTFTGDFKIEISTDVTPKLSSDVSSPATELAGGPMGMFR